MYAQADIRHIGEKHHRLESALNASCDDISFTRQALQLPNLGSLQTFQ